MGSNCCKEIKVQTDNISTTLSNSANYIAWIKGDKIGNGVSSTVYKAISTKTASIFAVKTISLSSKKKDHTRLFFSIQNEVDILKTLDHPNIIKFYQTEIDIETNEVFIICEYASNGNLLSVVRQFFPLPLTIVKKFTRELLRALSYIHSKGIIHRDIKCENVLIDQSSTAKLSDFGLSSVQSRNGFEVAGSPYWMAPEVFLGTQSGFEVDIWALGCTVIEMVTGVPPWSKIAKNEKELRKIITSPDLLNNLPKVSEDFSSFLRLCLNFDPKMRPQADELLNHAFLEEADSLSGGNSSMGELGC